VEPDLLSRLREIVGGHPTIVSAYLFGSRAKGRARPDSDVDLAVDWVAGLDAAARERAERELRASLFDGLGALGDRIDLVDLGRAGATLAFRVIRDGKLLFTRDRLARARLEARIARRYDDEQPHRHLFRRAAVKAGSRWKAGAHGRS
jgi:predicted nucleotidyltransferase